MGFVVIIIIIIIIICYLIYLRLKNLNDTPQKRLQQFHKQFLKKRHEKINCIDSEEVSEEKKIDTKTSYSIADDGTIIRNEDDSQQTNNYIPMSNANSKIIKYISAEDAASMEAVLRQRLLSGEQLDFADCNYMLDSTDEVAVWKAICKNHIQYPIYPPINIIENYNSERSIEFYDMIYRILNLCISEDNGWGVELSSEFVKNIISSSTNVDALYVIADFQEEDMHDPNYDNKPNIGLFNEIKKIAYNRYNYLTSCNKK